MAIYEYACKACELTWEEEQSIKDSPHEKCMFCGEKAAYRLISRTNFSLAGSGWAKDGYAKPSS